MSPPPLAVCLALDARRLIRSSREAWAPRPGRDGDERTTLGRFPGCLGVEVWGLDSPDEVCGPAAADEEGGVV